MNNDFDYKAKFLRIRADNVDPKTILPTTRNDQGHMDMPHDDKLSIDEWQKVRAEEIEEGEFFTKNRGCFAYLRVSDSSVKSHKLDPDKVYGVCHNGNMAVVEKDKHVYRCSIDLFQQQWNGV